MVLQSISVSPGFRQLCNRFKKAELHLLRLEITFRIQRGKVVVVAATPESEKKVLNQEPDITERHSKVS